MLEEEEDEDEEEDDSDVAEKLKELTDSIMYSLDLFQPLFDTMDHFDTSTATRPPLLPLLQV